MGGGGVSQQPTPGQQPEPFGRQRLNHPPPLTLVCECVCSHVEIALASPIGRPQGMVEGKKIEKLISKFHRAACIGLCGERGAKTLINCIVV